MKVKLLNQTRTDFHEALWQKYGALYKGGRLMDEAKGLFLIKNTAESGAWYQERLSRFHYKNMAGSFIDDIASSVFQSPLDMTLEKPESGERPQRPEFYTEFLGDPEGTGEGDFGDLMFEVLTTAMHKGEAWVLIGFPTSLPGQFRNRAEQEDAGDLRAMLRTVSPEQVIDAKFDEHGLEWAMLRHVEQASTPLEARVADTDQKPQDLWTWTWLDRTQIRRFQISVDRGKKPEGDDVAQELEPITHKLAGIGKVPLVRVKLKSSLWMMDRMASLACSETEKRNNLSWYETLACIPQLKFKGDDEDLKRPEEGQNTKRGVQYAWTIGKDDELEWLEVTGTSIGHLAERLDSLEGDLSKVAQQMAQAQGPQAAAALAQSAASKLRDSVTKQILCEFYAKAVRDASVQVMEMVSTSRADTGLEWVAAGVDEFDLVDTEAATSEANSGQMLLEASPSETFRKHWWHRFHRLLTPGVDQATRDAIENETNDYDFSEEAAEAKKVKAMEDEAKATAAGGGGFNG